ncbi:Uu.00g020900.m01.CDS01 [Anthostomella pinea]|uniref:Uu.00g020900.m01.CDS01 n=1 Tax=Anthostomella pinea TaxID=933095 RepID=A0AAI8YQX6_9PEZI|nr:Uu.00g020900.m01.CDS01 [Anthostomella pinea]
MSHVMALASASIDSLPNEVLIQALSSFSTRSLLPYAGVCRRFRGLVGRLHYYRLVEATVLQDHEVILESYHPSNKISTPSLLCAFLGTDGLSEAGEDASLEQLNRLYTRFRPYVSDDYRRPRSRWPTLEVHEGTQEPQVEVPSHDVNLESGELFSQLCTLTNMVKVGPRRGLFLSIANISDGVIRIWRDWLQNEAAKSTAVQQQQASPSLDDSSMLWTDSSKNVGLRFRVVNNGNGQAPILIGPNDELPVSYTLEYQELIIRTNQLVLSLETSKAHQVNHAGKALVIASM